MDILAWLWWLITKIIGFVWGIGWFLIGGWVSAIAQIAVIALVIYAMKYGWQRAPHEIWRASSGFGRFFWNWLRARDPGALASSGKVQTREVIRTVRVKEPGDVNLSTLLSLLMLAGIAMAIVAPAMR